MKMNWDYIAGFFDGEGSIHKNDQCSTHNSYMIALTQNTVDVLKEIEKFLIKNNVKCWTSNYKKKSRVYHLYISGYINVKRFLENIKNKIIVKENKVLNVLNNEKWTKFKTQYSDIEKDQIKILKKYGFSQRSIAKALNRDQGNISRLIHVRKYKNEKGRDSNKYLSPSQLQTDRTGEIL